MPMFAFSELKIPIIQAPMAGGLNTPELASAVANAGGVGSFGFAYSTPKKIAEDLKVTRGLTNGVLNANFFIFNPINLPNEENQKDAIEALKGLPFEEDYALTIPKAPFFPDLDAQLEPIWQHKPDMLTFHFGVPAQKIIKKAHSLGIAVAITATNVGEGVTIESAGADFIVAQGIEAGGHRGMFNPDASDENLQLQELVGALVRNTKLEVVAAGGIMNGGDVKTALQYGASAAQMGTAFLCCDEAGTPKTYREFLLYEQSRETSYTTAFSGRRAQGIDNQFMKMMKNKSILPFPAQNTLTSSLRKAAAKTNNGEYQSLWAGQAFGKIREMPAGDLMAKLVKEIAEA